MRREEINITEETQGTRLDLVLSAGLEDYSRSFIQKLFEKGGISVNGVICTSKKYKCSAGDRVEITIPEPEKLEAEAEDIPINVVYEDEDLIVVDKPAGMVVHPAPGNYSGTLVNALLYHCGDQLSSINGVIRPGIVHEDNEFTFTNLLRAHRAGHLAKKLYRRRIHDGSIMTSPASFSASYGYFVSYCAMRDELQRAEGISDDCVEVLDELVHSRLKLSRSKYQAMAPELEGSELGLGDDYLAFKTLVIDYVAAVKRTKETETRLQHVTTQRDERKMEASQLKRESQDLKAEIQRLRSENQRLGDELRSTRDQNMSLEDTIKSLEDKIRWLTSIRGSGRQFLSSVKRRITDK